MLFGLKNKGRMAILSFVILFITVISLLSPNAEDAWVSMEAMDDDDSVMMLVEKIIINRNSAMLSGDASIIEKYYDVSVTSGLYAYDQEVRKSTYIHSWAKKQGAVFTSINAKIEKNWVRHDGDTKKVNFMVSTEYQYVYEDRPEDVNIMRIGTYHEIVLKNISGEWIISREWYNDPFADSTIFDEETIEKSKEFILAQEKDAELVIGDKRQSAIEYADKYIGAADDGQNGYEYNPDYKNYNSVGGDCANFASQVLHEGGGFSKTGGWNYQKDGNRAWLNAQGFKDYLLYSGRGSLIASGDYDEVLKSSYKLMPGDIVAYQRKGKVTHVSVVSGADSRGYALVNCHNTDRYRVPWDLGFSGSNIKFYLIRVNY